MRSKWPALLFLCLFALAGNGAAFAEAWNWGRGPKPIYFEDCPSNANPKRDRDRICSAFIQSSFSSENFPHGVALLRERVSELASNYEDAAKAAFETYYWLVIMTLALAILGAGLSWWKGLSSERLVVLSAIGAAAITALSAFGYNTQFKAHFTAARTLATLRDELDIAIVEAARAKTAIPSELLSSSVQRYQEIIAKHVEDFGGALTPPTTRLLLP